MIIFTFDTETDEDDGRELYWLNGTRCTGKDVVHTAEIYEQLDAQTVGLA